MNKRIKKLWIKALRSRKFQQTQGQLCREVGTERRHCCLGVLEELAVSAGVIDRYDIWQGGLDRKVKEWAELDGTDPRLGPRRDSPRAAKLNDDGKSFVFIADRIEKYL